MFALTRDIYHHPPAVLHKYSVKCANVSEEQMFALIQQNVNMFVWSSVHKTSTALHVYMESTSKLPSIISQGQTGIHIKLYVKHSHVQKHIHSHTHTHHQLCMTEPTVICVTVP